MGPDVCLISSARTAAEEVLRKLRTAGLLVQRRQAGTLRCYTTDNPDRFARLATHFIGLGRTISSVEQVGTDELAPSGLP